jgi:leucyl/phenylalanyl-tRNA--protein transferase
MTTNPTANETDGWSFGDWSRQYAAAGAYALRPKRLAGMPGVLRAIAAHYMMPAGMRAGVPDPRHTLATLDGFAGICPDLKPETLMAGLRQGLFQNSHAGPYKWWSPVERMVLFPDELHLEKNLRRKLRQNRFSVTFDRDFAGVVRHCAGPRAQRRIQLTWLLPPVIDAYVGLHEAGHAHSVEIWNEEGKLVGGLFGTGFGRVFATDSQFALERDASKLAFAVLNRHLQAWGYVLNDVRRWSSHLERLGCVLVPRDDFLAIVERFGRDEIWEAGWVPKESLCAGDWDPATEPGWTRQEVYRAIAGKAAPVYGQGESEFAADADKEGDGSIPSAA